MSMAIHQIVSGFTRGDAISNLALRYQELFRSWGYASEIFCPARHISPEMRESALPLREHQGAGDERSVVIFHFSIGSETVDYFRAVPGRKMLLYHNITPGHYYRAIYDERETILNQGREALASLADVPDLTLADSSFNAAELEEAGFGNVGVMPIIIDFNRLSGRPDEGVITRYRDGVKNILFVGRVAPNKRFEDIIRVFATYRRVSGTRARLLLVGSHLDMERYLAYLRNIVRELELDDVLFTGHTRRDELIAYYRVADCFLCMSEHEGFCIPLVESMYFDVPILAYRAAAVPETLGGSGVLVREKDFARIAEMMELLLYDAALREKIIEGQRARLKEFEPAVLEQKLQGYLQPWLSS